MALTYGFFNSLNFDRPYDALQISKLFDGLILDGVYEGVGDRLMVTPGVGEGGVNPMTVKVGTGRAWFNHTWTLLDTPLYLNVDPANPILGRKDVLYLEVDSDVGTRANKIDILKGVSSSTPIIPELISTLTVFRYPIAYITIRPGLQELTQANIENLVGTSLCPFVICPLTSISTSELLIQWETQWLEWFDAIKDQLTEEAATHLQAQIWAIVGNTNPPPLSLVEINEKRVQKQIFIPASQFVPLAAGATFLDVSIDGRVLALAKLDTWSTIATCNFHFPTETDTNERIWIHILYKMTGNGAWMGRFDMAELPRLRVPGTMYEVSKMAGFPQAPGGNGKVECSTLAVNEPIYLQNSPSANPEGLACVLRIGRVGEMVGDTNTQPVEIYGIFIEYTVKHYPD